MTTIAWDGKTLAGDSLYTQRDVRVSHVCGNKVRRLANGMLIGLAGDVCYHSLVVDWVEGGQSGPPPKGDYQVILVSADGGRVFRLIDGDGAPYEVQAPLAVGSGALLALSAMDHGRDAVGAVEYAITRDIYSGGAVIALQVTPETVIQVA